MSNTTIKQPFSFEKEIIDPILNLIKDNQEYLTQKENLPQLAKLGYMYNTLWYMGRSCWGYDGELSNKYNEEMTSFLMSLLPDDVNKDNEEEVKDALDDLKCEYISCEDNPKYKIEMCDPINDEIENLIYDAWGMHVENEANGISFEMFKDFILNGKVLSDYEKRSRKVNKTIDEWVEVMTHPEYKYRSKTRREVLNYLMCVGGTGFGLSKDGFIIREASGADQDQDLYGEWENAQFADNIQQVVNEVLGSEKLKETFDTNAKIVNEYLQERKGKERKSNEVFYKILLEEGLITDKDVDLDWNELSDLLNQTSLYKNSGILKPRDSYSPYYPIYRTSTIYKMVDPESRKRENINHIDPSYLEAAKEICLDILSHEKEESEKNSKNVQYAKEILGLLGVEGFELTKTFDKYELLKQIKLSFDNLDVNKSITLNDTATNEYADNSINIVLTFNDEQIKSLPTKLSNTIDVLKGSDLGLREILDSISTLKGVEFISFFYTKDRKSVVKITIHTNKDSANYAKSIKESDDRFISQGFELNEGILSLDLEMGISLSIRKPQPRGDNEYFSNALSMSIKGIENLSLNLDERGFNIAYFTDKPTSDLSKWILSEFDKMKASDPKYGTYDSKNRVGEGQRKLYAHDFMLWLKNNQTNFK